jgi:hypothetical protein
MRRQSRLSRTNARNAACGRKCRHSRPQRVRHGRTGAIRGSPAPNASPQCLASNAARCSFIRGVTTRSGDRGREREAHGEREERPQQDGFGRLPCLCRPLGEWRCDGGAECDNDAGGYQRRTPTFGVCDMCRVQPDRRAGQCAAADGCGDFPNGCSNGMVRSCSRPFKRTD